MKSGSIITSILFMAFASTAMAAEICPSIADIQKNAESIDTVFHRANVSTVPNYLALSADGTPYSSKTFTALKKPWHLLAPQNPALLILADDIKLILAPDTAKNVVRLMSGIDVNEKGKYHMTYCDYSTNLVQQPNETAMITAIYVTGSFQAPAATRLAQFLK